MFWSVAGHCLYYKNVNIFQLSSVFGLEVLNIDISTCRKHVKSQVSDASDAWPWWWSTQSRAEYWGASSSLSGRCWVHPVQPRRTSPKRTALDLTPGQSLVWNLRQTGLASLWPMDPKLGESVHIYTCVVSLSLALSIKTRYTGSLCSFSCYSNRSNGRKTSEVWLEMSLYCLRFYLPCLEKYKKKWKIK